MMVPDYFRHLLDRAEFPPRLRIRLDRWWSCVPSTIVSTPFGGAICSDDGRVEIYAGRI